MKKIVGVMVAVVGCVVMGCGPVGPFGEGCPPVNSQAKQEVIAYGAKDFQVQDVNGAWHEVVIDVDPSNMVSALDVRGLLWRASDLLIPSALALSCIDPDEAYFKAQVDIYRLDVETRARKEQVFSQTTSGSYRLGGEFTLWGVVDARFNRSSGSTVDIVSFMVDDPAIKISHSVEKEWWDMDVMSGDMQSDDDQGWNVIDMGSRAWAD